MEAVREFYKGRYRREQTAKLDLEKEGKKGKETYGAVDLDSDLAPGLHVSEVLGGSDVDALGERGGGEGKERDGELHCVEEEGKSGGFCEVKCRGLA